MRRFVSGRLLAVIAACWVSAMLTAGSRAATVSVGTMPGNDASGTNGDFGQTVLAPMGAEVRLSGYQVMLTSVQQGTIQSAVFPVNPQTSVITGAPLWESDLRTVPPTGAVPNSVTLSFDPNELLLDSGATYALMIRQSGLGNTVLTGLGFRSSTATDVYTDGSLRFIAAQPYPYTGSTLHALTLKPWQDLAFSATFSVVPEPSAAVLGALTVIAGTLRRRRSSHATSDSWSSTRSRRMASR